MLSDKGVVRSPLCGTQLSVLDPQVSKKASQVRGARPIPNRLSGNRLLNFNVFVTKNGANSFLISARYILKGGDVFS